MKQRRIDTPVGHLTVTEHDGAIVGIHDGDTELQSLTPLLRRACDQLLAYFDGSRREFDVPVSPPGSAFQRRVWNAMRRIPFGTVASYGGVAREIGTGPRAVGNACAANPVMILIPCHRVLAAGGKIGGYSNLALKRRLLCHEGIILPE